MRKLTTDKRRQKTKKKQRIQEKKAPTFGFKVVKFIKY